MLAIHAQALSWVGQQRRIDQGCKTSYQSNKFKERRQKCNWPRMSPVSKRYVVQTECNGLTFDLFIFGFSLPWKSESIKFLRIRINVLHTSRIISRWMKLSRWAYSVMVHGITSNSHCVSCRYCCSVGKREVLQNFAQHIYCTPRKYRLEVIMMQSLTNIPLGLPRRRSDSLTKLSSLYILSIASLVTPSLAIASTSSRSSGTWCEYAAKSYRAWVIAYRKQKCTPSQTVWQ
jgi:hypothetical protein